MFGTIDEMFRERRAEAADRKVILEAVEEMDSPLPGDTDEMEFTVDPDSVPDDVYDRVDKVLTQIVTGEDYDDAGIEELIGGPDGQESVVEEAIHEAAFSYLN